MRAHLFKKLKFTGKKPINKEFGQRFSFEIPIHHEVFVKSDIEG